MGYDYFNKEEQKDKERLDSMTQGVNDARKTVKKIRDLRSKRDKENNKGSFKEEGYKQSPQNQENLNTGETSVKKSEDFPKNKGSEDTKEAPSSKSTASTNNASESITSKNSSSNPSAVNESINVSNNNAVSGSSASTGGSATASGTASASGTSGGSAAAGGTAASGTAAGGGAAAAGGGVAAAGGGIVILIVVLIVGVVLAAGVFVMWFTYLQPANIAKVVGHAIWTGVYSVFDTVDTTAETILYALNPFEDSPTADSSLEEANVPIPVEYEDYNPKNAQDMSMLEEYKLIAVSLSRAYDYAVEEVKQKCKDNNYDVDLTMEALNAKYPNGWQDVYKNVNYGDLIILYYYYIHDSADTWDEPDNIFKNMWDKYVNGINEENQEGLQNTYTFSGIYLEKIEDLILDENNFHYFYQTGFEIAFTKEEAYLDIVIEPYCWNDLYDLIEKNPNDEYDKYISYYAMHENMSDYLAAVCEDANGDKKPIYNLLKMDNDFIPWNRSIVSNDIRKLYKWCVNFGEDAEINQAVLWRMLRTAGYSNQAAAGICGNIMAESGFATTWIEDSAAVGIALWDKEEDIQALEELALDFGIEKTDIHVQATYLVNSLELKAEEYQIEKLKNAKSVQEAADLFCAWYMRPSHYATKEAWKWGGHGNINNEQYISWERYIYTDVENPDNSKIPLYYVDLDKRRTYSQAAYMMYREYNPMSWPVPSSGLVITNFLPQHKSIDIRANEDDPVHVTLAGKVVIVIKDNESYGSFITIEHAGGVRTVYKHLKTVYVAEGDYVYREQMIGSVGNTGNATCYHLDYVVYDRNLITKEFEYMNPFTYVTAPDVIPELKDEEDKKALDK